MAYFNIVLVRRDYFENTEEGKQAIGSLTELMRLMGPKYITNVKLKIMAMLRYVLYNEGRLIMCAEVCAFLLSTSLVLLVLDKLVGKVGGGGISRGVGERGVGCGGEWWFGGRV